jgi:ABC-type transporter MlaC component
MKRFLFGLVVSWTVSFVLGTPAAQAGDLQTPSKLVDGLVHDAVARLSVKGLPRTEREHVVRDLITRYSSQENLAQHVLGRSWGSASEDERSQFENRFGDYMVALCSGMLKDVPADVKLVVQGEEPHGDETIVHSAFVDPGGNATPVDWSVATAGDGHLFLSDVAAEGVSLVRTMGSDFRSVLMANGGRISALLAEMDHKITVSAE